MSQIRFTKQPTPGLIPPSGKSWVFVDDADDHLKRLKDDGSVFDYEVSIPITNSVTTTNNAPTEIFDIAIASDGTYLFELKLSGVRLSGSGSDGDSAVFIRHFRVRSISGTVSVDGLQSSYTKRDDRDYGLNIQISGSGLIIYVIGKTSTNIRWKAELKSMDNI